MTTRIAINGFGRIGRMILRAFAENYQNDLQFVAINDLGSLEANAHLLKYDSVHGKFPKVSYTAGFLDVGFGPIKVLAEPTPEKLPWQEMGVDIVFECSGRFTSKAAAVAHIKAGAKRVLISAPADGVDMTVVYGVNHYKLNAEHTVISNGSCTTNCLAPIASVLQKKCWDSVWLYDNDPCLYS